MYQEPTDISTYFYDASSIAISFTESDTSFFNGKHTFYYMASATDINSNVKYATGNTSPIYITNLVPGTTYTCNLYLVQTASSDIITINTESFPSFDSVSIIELSMNSIKLNWIGSDISYVSIKRSIVEQTYTDLSSVYSEEFTYSDSDISGNTLYSYSITPYMTKYGSLIQGADTILSNTTPVAYPTDLSASFFDTSAIEITFTEPKNTYTSFVYYTLRVINSTTGSYKEVSGNTPPLMITDLSGKVSYNCYILTYLDNNNISYISDFISVSTVNVNLKDVDILLPPTTFYSPVGGNVTGIAITSNKMLLCESSAYKLYYLTYDGTSWGTWNANVITSIAQPKTVALSSDGTRGILGSVTINGYTGYNASIKAINWTDTIPTFTTVSFTNYIIDGYSIPQCGISADGTKFIISSGYGCAWGTWDINEASPNTTLNLLTRNGNGRNNLYCNISKDGNVIAYSGSYNYRIHIGLWNGTDYIMSYFDSSLTATTISNIEVFSNKTIFININGAGGGFKHIIYYNTSTFAWEEKYITSTFFKPATYSSCVSTDETKIFLHSINQSTIQEFDMLFS